MTLFKGKYRIESNRLQNWDYSGNGHYFITIVTENRDCIFGEIENNKLIPSDFGIIADIEWLASFDIRKELLLDEYILMPNHLHAIIIIKKPASVVQTYGRPSRRGSDHPDQLETGLDKSNPKLYRKPKSISSFLAGYKSSVNTKIDDFIDQNKLDLEKYNKYNKLWQSNYHDHIIRNMEEYWRIKKYIQNNPKNWKLDKQH
ncbi:MAG: transposase [Bacteroidetes bacterium]|nr:transposase [Bacteroidota bacterium]